MLVCILTLVASLLLGWSDEDIDYLASQAIVRNYGSNTEIQKAGERVNALAMVKSGECGSEGWEYCVLWVSVLICVVLMWWCVPCA
jgi:hypothetical protein